MTLDPEVFDPLPRVAPLPENPDADDKGSVSTGRFPKWLHRKIPKGAEYFHTNDTIQSKRLFTVCEEAKCPNRLECYSKKTATFLALGKECTRNCGFCDIDFSKNPAAPDVNEPKHIAQSVKMLGLEHAVVTMVARDDLPDQGASHIVKIVQEIRKHNPGVTVELLTSDFSESLNAWNILFSEPIEIFNHNIETVERLSPRVRHKAQYHRTLRFLEYASKKPNAGWVKSGIMVGLGEEKKEVFATLHDLKNAGCSVVTIGQYLQANLKKLRVKRFVAPEEFKEYEDYGLSIGLKQVYSGPFVRSSYNAKELLGKIQSESKNQSMSNATT